LSQALDKPLATSQREAKVNIMKASIKCIGLIKKFESLHDGDLSLIGLQPKMDPIGIWTEGYGHAMRFNGSFLKGSHNKSLAYSLQSIRTEADAIRILTQEDIPVREGIVTRHVRVAINQNQFDALVSFTFNVGEGNLATSTLLRKVNTNPADPSIRREFDKWVYSEGRKLQGLVNRRKEEANLYFS